MSITWKYRLGWMIVLIAYAYICVGQSGDRATADQLKSFGDAFFEKEEYEAARHQYQQALERYQSLDDYVKRAEVHLWLSEVDYAEWKIEAAMEQAHKGLDLIEWHQLQDSASFYPTLLQNIGVFSSAKGDLDSQMTYYRKAHQAALRYNGWESKAAADAYHSLGVAYGSRGNWKMAEALTDTSLIISEKLEDQEMIATAYHNLAYIYAAMGDYQRAKEAQKTALGVSRKDKDEICKGLGNLGTYQADMGEYDAALSNLDSALSCRQSRNAPIHELLRIQLSQVRAYSASGNTEKAETLLDDIFQKLYRLDPLDTGSLHVAINYKANLLLGEELLEEALATIRKTYSLPANWSLKSSSLLIEGSILAKMGCYQDALYFINDGLSMLAGGYTFASPVHDNPDWRSYKSVEKGRELLQLKGSLLREMALADNDLDLLQGSLTTLTQGDSLVVWCRSNFRSRTSKDVLAANANELYAELLATLFQLYEQTNDLHYFDTALDCMEKTKAQSILENLNAQQVRSFRGVPEGVVQEEQTYLNNIEQYNTQLKLVSSHASKEQISQWEQALSENKRSLDSLLRELRRDYPRYFQMKHQYVTASSDDIAQRLLMPDELMLEYFLYGDKMFLLAIDGSQRLFFQRKTDDLNKKCATLRQTILNAEQLEDFYSVSHDLYQQLLAPVAFLLPGKDLVIVPDGMLSYIPFDLLLTNAVDTSRFVRQHELPYLLQDHAIRYYFSANAAIQFLDEDNRSDRGGQLFAIAPKFGAGTSYEQERSLPGAQTELDSLEMIFRGQFLRGNDAKESTFKQRCKNQGVYHIATHAKVDDELAAGSFLLLEPNLPDEEATEDGKLFVYELYNLSMGAGLTILSGCNTGIGAIKTGEGSASLAHACAYAGCSNLMMSLWAVEDERTALLMSQFYRNLADGMPKHKALRAAKLFCLNYDELYAAPYYWSAFLYVGDADPISIRKRPSRWRVAGLLGAGVLLVVLLITFLVKRGLR